MDEDYERNVGKVMEYLSAAGRSKAVLRNHRACYDQLGSYLQENGLAYSDDAAWEWLEDASQGLGETARSIYAGALGKIGDIYATGEIRSHHRRAPTKEDRLGEQNRQALDGYCQHLQEARLSPVTVANHRACAVRIMIALQDRKVGFVADAAYEDWIAIMLDCEEMTYRAKTGYREKARSLLGYLHSAGLAGFGLTLVVDAMALKKGYCWNGVGPEVVEGLRADQSGDGGVSPEECLRIVGELADEHVARRYSHGAVCSVRHFGNLLYLFLEVNGLRFDPDVAQAWLESMAPSLPYGDFATCRRVVMLLLRRSEGLPFDLARPFAFKETLRDRLPAWCAPEVDAFLAMKEAEGWRKSTLDMFRTCTCRFCLFLDGVGVRDFADLTAEHVKLFNVEDKHATPEGKNASNSRARQFLEWLGLIGELRYPHLHLALPNASAPSVKEVVTLTPDEQRTLRAVMASETGVTLRDKAMLRLGLGMGMRASDVAGLCAGDIDWDDATIRFVQAKTGYEVNLPMPDDVANAIFRYVVSERPESRSQSVFLRCRAPYSEVGASAAQQSLRNALPERRVPKSGFHSLRKTFASNMLGGGADPGQVAEALGHRGLDNVRKYLSLDAGRMRLCAISLAESGLAMEGGLGDGD